MILFFSILEKLVERIFLQVNVAKREAEMQLDTKDFDERIQNYRRKRWLTEGLDPDEMEAKWRKEQKRKLKERRKAQQAENIKRKSEPVPLLNDDRFNTLDVQDFKYKNQKKHASTSKKVVVDGSKNVKQNLSLKKSKQNQKLKLKK